MSKTGTTEKSDPWRVPIVVAQIPETGLHRDIEADPAVRDVVADMGGLREVRLIHGRGKGVQRGIVQKVLDQHPLVEEFWDATETHLGATVARLR